MTNDEHQNRCVRDSAFCHSVIRHSPLLPLPPPAHSFIPAEAAVVSESYHVRIAKTEHVFSAAHFITYGGQCERLHGHDYHVSAEVHGPLDNDQLVVDFLAVRAALSEIVAELDHYVLLPAEHPQLRIAEQGNEVVVSLADRRWVLPKGDCRLLPLANTTAELLAAYIGGRLLNSLENRTGLHPERLQVEVDECDGQVAAWSTSGLPA
jgi:6-pyruvoyltetrahydropterin/6-carboxytetrahydropterin synthase